MADNIESLYEEANNYYYESESNKKSLANKVEALMWENIELRKNISK